MVVITRLINFFRAQKISKYINKKTIIMKHHVNLIIQTPKTFKINLKIIKLFQNQL